MVKRWDVAVVEYGKNGTTLDVAYGQNVGHCGCRILEKWDNIICGLWSKCGTIGLWNMGKWDNIRRGLRSNVGRCGYGIWEIGQH